MEKTVQQELADYFGQLTEAEQQSVLNLVKTIAIEKEEQWMDSYNKEIDAAMSEIDRGEFLSQEDALVILKDRK